MRDTAATREHSPRRPRGGDVIVATMRWTLAVTSALLLGCPRPAPPPQEPSATGSAEPAAPLHDPARASPCALADTFPFGLPNHADEVRELFDLFVLQGLVESCAPGPALRRRAAGHGEDGYCVAATQADACDDPDLGVRLRERADEYPQSIGAWIALASFRYRPLHPDPETQLPYNETLRPEERRQIADTVLEALRNAEAIDPDDRRVYVGRAAAYTQRAWTWMVLERPESPPEELEAIQARQDWLEAWRAEQRRCELDGDTRCPPPPQSPREIEADRTRASQLQRRK